MQNQNLYSTALKDQIHSAIEKLTSAPQFSHETYEQIQTLTKNPEFFSAFENILMDSAQLDQSFRMMLLIVFKSIFKPSANNKLLNDELQGRMNSLTNLIINSNMDFKSKYFISEGLSSIFETSTEENLLQYKKSIIESNIM